MQKRAEKKQANVFLGGFAKGSGMALTTCPLFANFCDGEQWLRFRIGELSLWMGSLQSRIAFYGINKFAGGDRRYSLRSPLFFISNEIQKLTKSGGEIIFYRNSFCSDYVDDLRELVKAIDAIVQKNQDYYLRLVLSISDDEVFRC